MGHVSEGILLHISYMHLFGRFCASQKVKTIGRNVYSLLDAVSHSRLTPSLPYLYR